MKNTAHFIAILLLLLVAPPLPAAEHRPPMIAVAANFMGAMEKIAETYEAETGIKMQLVFSSTGKLYAQITQGAPYDLFFAADARRPELLAEASFCEEPFIYAEGETVLWTRKKSLVDGKYWHEVITRDTINKIAVSTPQIAPYGAAAMAAVNEMGLENAIADKFVYGHNVAQAFQFAFLGNTDLGFTALSLALSDKGREGKYWRIPEAEKVVQKACAVKATKNKNGVAGFLRFFKSPITRSILDEFGYK